VTGQVVNTCASFTNQHNLVLTRGRWCFVAGKLL